MMDFGWHRNVNDADKALNCSLVHEKGLFFMITRKKQTSVELRTNHINQVATDLNQIRNKE